MRGVKEATLAVPGPLQPIAIAAMEAAGDGHPLVVLTPTLSGAERLVQDIGCFVGPRSIALFPPWETLPLERVSPDTATMGARVSVLWRLFGEEPEPQREPPGIVVAPIRSALQRLVPGSRLAGPFVVRASHRLDREALLRRLAASGYRREPQVEHRGEMAVRGGIIDVFPSTADRPVRIDLLGDEVERLSIFDVSDQRSTEALDQVSIFACRELELTSELRARAAQLGALGALDRGQWDRLAAGELFDGMEAWLPWLVEEELFLCDLLGPEAKVILSEPRRLADRAIEVFEEEEALGGALASTWGGADSSLPRLHAHFERLLATSQAQVLALPAMAEGPDVPALVARGLAPNPGDPAKLAAELAALARDKASVVVCAAGPASGERMSKALGDHDVVAPVVDHASGGAGVEIVVASLSSGFGLEEPPLFVLAEADITGRRQPHRRPRPQTRATVGFFDDLAPGSFVVHRSHGVARYAGALSRSFQGTTRDYLVLEYRGSDRLYLPVEQIDALTPYLGADTPSLSKMGGADWQRTRARA
ncbi:MAG: CarD family transcriptional regulator, partial [Acidimicrobiales bacterium]